ncbi:MAG: alanine racemase [Treponema sp.]|jgi:alanine racemase|nr:alanine racemase [Treponema sp.]
MRPTKAIIHLSSLEHNIAEIKKLLSRQTRLCVPVKADAYGHGAVQCSRKALESGADCLGIATVSEGVELRDAGIIAPVLLFSSPLGDEISEVVSRNLTPFVFEPFCIRLLEEEAARRGKTATVHLKVDTGMSRVGCRPEDAASLARLIVQCKHLKLGGMATHFAVSDSLENNDEVFTHEQFRRFTAAVAAVKREGVDPGICHCANSSATLRYPETHLDMVRPGIMVYGCYPGDYRKGAPVLAEKHPVNLEPVMDVVTQITAVKDIPLGTSVSYGRRWTSAASARIATLPIGYADGLRRRLSLTGFVVAVGDKHCPVRGTICMDQCMIDLTAAPDAAVGDKATVFGAKCRGAIFDAGALGELIGTIPYEILTSMSRRVPRIYRQFTAEGYPGDLEPRPDRRNLHPVWGHSRC